MKCITCHSGHVALNGKYKDGKQRYKCVDCGKQFCETTGSLFHKHRIPVNILVVAIFFHLFVPSSIVRIFIKFLFGCTLSGDTVCSWSKKFLSQMPDIQQCGKNDNGIVIRHTDEKQIRIGKRKAWWWNTTDGKSNPLTSTITMSRSLADTKKHTRKHKKVESKIDINITDGLPSYNKSMSIYGRKSKHIIRGLQEKICMFKGKILSLSNLPVERLHSKIEDYLRLKVRSHFSNLEQAERTRKAFMLIQLIQKQVAKSQACGTPPTAPLRPSLLAELTIPKPIWH